jgi:hypothetical protein
LNPEDGVGIFLRNRLHGVSQKAVTFINTAVRTSYPKEEAVRLQSLFNLWMILLRLIQLQRAMRPGVSFMIRKEKWRSQSFPRHKNEIYFKGKKKTHIL